jgi:hypothetical protein
MSFMLTTGQVLDRSKTVTRRSGWLRAKVGDIVQPVRKGMGLKKGDTVERLGPPIRFTDVRRLPLDAGMTWAECQLEGFPSMSPRAFVDMYVEHNGGTRDQLVTRIAFEYLDTGRPA